MMSGDKVVMKYEIFEGPPETCQEGRRMHSGKIFLICSNCYRWIAVLIRMPYITLMMI